jgi:Fe-S oxidoreductase
MPVVHHSQFLLELIESGRLNIKKDSFEEMVYHDSCYLGRWNGIYDAPRQLLQAVTNGKSLIELQRSHSSGFCCGAGGARLFMEETIGQRINHARSEEILATRAKTVAAACPFCITMLRDGIADNDGDAIVQDIAEIVDAATV